jgi:hypothetical protein
MATIGTSRIKAVVTKQSTFELTLEITLTDLRSIVIPDGSAIGFRAHEYGSEYTIDAQSTINGAVIREAGYGNGGYSKAFFITEVPTGVNELKIATLTFRPDANRVSQSVDDWSGILSGWGSSEYDQVAVGLDIVTSFSARDIELNGQLVDLTQAPESAGVPAIRGNSLYTIVPGPSWTKAEANAVKLGGNLATINDDTENAFAWKTFGPSNTPAEEKWIGLNDERIEGVWEWSSGEDVTYTNWASVAPANSSGIQYEPGKGSETQDYVNFWWGTNDGTWDDYYNEGNGGNSKGIAEIPFIRRGDSAYVIVQGPTWEEAEANAVALGGHLVTINDAEENEWIRETFARAEKHYQEDTQDIYWNGLQRTQENTWRWASGEPATYTNFGPKEPFNGAPYSAINTFDIGRYSGDWWGAVSGSWVDSGGNRDPGLYGIAEIKLAPNNAPTGNPTLSATTKVGQVISIDKTPIQDADNFTGYTPDFKYTWEASSNGTTWSPLTSTDATDNNSTYTLTTAEVGKQVRGVVSYLDGYGTQESVASTASAPITSSAPPVQSLTLTPPSKNSIRSGVNTTSLINYAVSTGEKSLTGIGVSLYFDSTQLTVGTVGDPFQKGLLGIAITADTNNADGDPKTDKILSLNYADFGGDFPGSGKTLPLTLADLNLTPTSSYTGTTLHLKGSPAIGYTATGADLTLGYNAAPVVNSTLPALTTNRGRAFSYTFRSDLFTDSDSTLTLSATTATGSSLPSWLTFNPTTRTLAGTPTTGGTLNLNITASDELGSVTTPLSIKVREVQSLSSNTTPIRYQRNKDITIPINYSTTDGSSSTGLAFRVHFNSNLFSFDPATGIKNKVQADIFEVGAVQLDTANTDNDSATDRFVSISIASLSGQLPSASKLADLTFRAADKAIDPLTGLKDTSINFTESTLASGYGFFSTSASLKPFSFSLDVDGDGLVTALGDGLMVIRYLFGTAFTGEALINKALSPDSPLLGGIAYTSMTPQQKTDVAAQVAAKIQQGVDSGLFDVDKDGKTTALGDGLMVIRHLFGNAFAGDALIAKAISPTSPYFGDANASSLISSNIDSLRPVVI